MEKYLFSILLLAASSTTFAQSIFKRNDIYGEFGGNGFFASVNYERQLTSKPGFGFRAGLGYCSADEKFRFSIPVAALYLVSLKKEKSFLDLSLGASWVQKAAIKIYKRDTETDFSEHMVGFFPGIGYRHHTKGNFMWRASFTPFISNYRSALSIGLSVGKRF